MERMILGIHQHQRKLVVSAGKKVISNEIVSRRIQLSLVGVVLIQGTSENLGTCPSKESIIVSITKIPLVDFAPHGLVLQ